MECHTIQTSTISSNAIALIGQPNVGKSVLFHKLTGQRVIVSNYPGTTVEIARSASKGIPGVVLVDTPGLVTFPTFSEDEQATARVLLEEPLRAILQVGDAKNLRRTLMLSAQLAEMGLPLVLALNMSDEAHRNGLEIDADVLSRLLGFSAVPTTATRSQGIVELTRALVDAQKPTLRIQYSAEVESALEEIEPCIPESQITCRSIALLFIGGDPIVELWLEKNLGKNVFVAICAIRERLRLSAETPPDELIQTSRREWMESILREIVQISGNPTSGLVGRLSAITTHPVWGMVVFSLVLYGLYWFVGVFGAGTLVGLLEENLFAEIINPAVVKLTELLVPVSFLRNFLVGEYGLWTMGMTYALALILPIVTTFFLAFGLMEDSGYLPRLAVLSNRLFEKLGLNGKAVLPMVLGLGCVTMATLTTRVLETKRERFLVILLLVLAIPCSAQLGVVMGMLAGISLYATMIWGAVVLLVFFAVGWLAARLVPGERAHLLVELPPLRVPVFSNVIMKTLARLEWYIKEVIPLFLLGTAVMFVLDITGLLAKLEVLAMPLVTEWLGLPSEASAAFLMGFMRRDFGATGLFVLESQGLMTAEQVVVSMVTITLFIPCVASVMMIAKEANWKRAAAMVVVVFPLAIIVGGLLHKVLALIGWGL